jgi:hypothetical protein
MPPIAIGCALPWDADCVDPIADLARARATCGDTFVVDSGEDRYLFTFSPTGVASFYALPEERASKGVADWRMLRRKLPDGLFAGRRTLPGQLFARGDVASYLANVDRALDATVEELGAAGSFEVFTLTRRLGHRIGLASWGGPQSAEGERFEALVAAFDALDGSESFVHPDAMADVAGSGKRAEYAARRSSRRPSPPRSGNWRAQRALIRSSPGWPRGGRTSRRPTPPGARPTTWRSSTWLRCPISSPPSAGHWWTSWSGRPMRHEF